MPDIPTPDSYTPIVNGSGVMTDSFSRWALLVTRNDPIIGTGSPEGVVTSNFSKQYIDTSTSPATQYFNETLSSNTGWIQL